MHLVHGVDNGLAVLRKRLDLSFLSRSFAASTCPPNDAVVSADMPSDRALLASASLFRSDFMTLARPSPAAIHYWR